jgi:hypothetical protein
MRQLRGPEKADTAAATIDFCGPFMLQASALSAGDIQFLQGARRFRNELVHQALRRAFLDPTLATVSDDINRMIQMAHAVESWQKSNWPPPPVGTSRMALSFGGLLQSCLDVASELAREHLVETET